MSATYHALAPQIRALRRSGYVAHVIDLPGMAYWPPLRPEDASFERMADLVGDVVRHLGIGRAVFVGHSLGGGIALHLAIRHRELVDGLALLAPAALGRSLLWLYKLYCLPVVGRALMRPMPRASLGYARRFVVGRIRRDDARFLRSLLRLERPSAGKALTTRAIVWANQPRRWRRLTSLLLPGGEQSAFSLAPRLAELRGLPLLVLWGADDRVICPGDARACRVALPDARVRIAPGIGHMLTLEAPVWTNHHLERFLREVPAGARDQAA
jgi:proline iminopeptidase